MVSKTPTEAEKLALVPGIYFADGGAGRRAKIGGTGLNVFDIIRAYRSCDHDRGRVDDYYEWLTPEQLDAAFAYYAAFPDEIDEWLRLEAEEMREDMLARGITPDF